MFGYAQQSRFGYRYQARNPVGPSGLVVDTFTDTDATALDAHAPDTDASGLGWTVHSGAAAITGNAAVWSATGVATIDATAADVVITMEAQATVAVSRHVNFYFRFVDPDNHHYVVWRPTNDIKIYKRVAGVLTELPAVRTGTAQSTFGLSTPYAVTITLVGDSATFQMEGFTMTATLPADFLTATRVGIGANNGAGPTFDDFTVQAA